MKRAAAEQVPMSYSKRGGARLGAGRPKKKDAGVSHRERPALSEKEPVHVTLRVREDVFNLRSERCFQAIREAFEACRDGLGFRSVGLSVQGNHIHLLGEAASTEALALGIQGLKVRIAKGLNRVMGRRGKVFSERYHLRVLKTPTDARATLGYVANNTAKHAAQAGKRLPSDYRDPYTVGHFGDRVLLPPGTAAMVVEPASWLLREGWRRRARPRLVVAQGVPAVAVAPRARARKQARCSAALPLFGREVLGAMGPPLLPRPEDGHTPSDRSRAA